MQPQITVIIPAFNAGKYIGELLDSLENQSFQNFDIIIVNDGSEDDTMSVVESFMRIDDRIRCFSQSNQGQSVARNNALPYVDGEYIAFIDADDVVSSHYLEKLYNAIGKNDVALCSYQKYQSSTGKVFLKRFTEDWNIPFSNGYFHVFQYSPCARLCKTDFIKKYDFRFGEGEQLEDGPYCMAMGILADNVAIVNDVEYFYRVYDNSTMGNVRKGYKPKVPFKSLETAINQVLAGTDDKIKRNILEYCSVKIMAGWLTNMYKNCDLAVRREICEYCYRVMEKYFCKVYKNPFLLRQSDGEKKLPLSHRIAVILFVIAYKGHLLMPYSVIASSILKIV